MLSGHILWDLIVSPNQTKTNLLVKFAIFLSLPVRRRDHGDNFRLCDRTDYDLRGCCYLGRHLHSRGGSDPGDASAFENSHWRQSTCAPVMTYQ